MSWWTLTIMEVNSDLEDGGVLRQHVWRVYIWTGKFGGSTTLLG